MTRTSATRISRHGRTTWSSSCPCSGSRMRPHRSRRSAKTSRASCRRTHSKASTRRPGPSRSNRFAPHFVTGYLARRVVQATFVVFGVTLLVFLLEHVIPGGAARAALGQRASQAQIEQFNELNGYDLPIWHQFLDYCRDLILHFNLGYSYK